MSELLVDACAEMRSELEQSISIAIEEMNDVGYNKPARRAALIAMRALLSTYAHDHGWLMRALEVVVDNESARMEVWGTK